jgi:acyl-CoA thioesterase II
VEIDEAEEAELVSASVADLVAAVTAEEGAAEPGGSRVFTTTSPDWWRGDRTFGGMVVAQSLSAAMQTAPAGFEVHSLHGYFLRPVSPGTRTTHVVSVVRDGRSFGTREVVSTTDGKETFRMTCSFHAPEEGDEYQLPMAQDVPPPSEIEGFEAPFPYDIRELGHTERREDGTYLSTRRCWFRTREPLPDDPAVHACVLAYFSDMTGASFRPGSIGTWGTHTDASLDHALWFHRPWRADRWSLFDVHALANAGGRGTIRATMHGEDGTLHLSMAQELLIRRLEVPLVFDRPPWLPRAAPAAPGEREDEGGSGHGAP